MPFTTEQFFEVFAKYNQAIWPAQAVAYLLGLAAMSALFRPGATSNRLVSGVLSIFWLWNGAAYHIGHFAAINTAAYVFGAFFIVQGIAFAWMGVLSDHLSFRFALRPAPVIGAVLIVYAMVVYEILGLVAGHGLMAGPLFGIAPCPTTIFTFGMLVMADRRIPVWIHVIPAMWAIIGSGAALFLNVPEDHALIVAMVLGVALPVRRTDEDIHKGLSS